MDLTKIGITMGDPAGIGPELCLRALQNQELLQECCPIVFGNVVILKRVAEVTGLPFTSRLMGSKELSKADEPCVVDCAFPECESIVPARVDANAGAAAFT